ncbi:hypothetical protein HERIO_2035 [Hepatospora eriocheir]|uniref:Uncharacterized protein n=1 Tax=Hepatospora eriocheir TaxID=1081669 RepID=A0A1X0Q875_9MICR|nr:hypothetical protein HERIO_2035 [Hepatospora eriocheir]
MKRKFLSKMLILMFCLLNLIKTTTYNSSNLNINETEEYDSSSKNEFLEEKQLIIDFQVNNEKLVNINDELKKGRVNKKRLDELTDSLKIIFKTHILLMENLVKLQKQKHRIFERIEIMFENFKHKVDFVKNLIHDYYKNILNKSIIKLETITEESYHTELETIIEESDTELETNN